jgi:aminoglycoside phosphotransferase (APT) family kinase protein
MLPSGDHPEQRGPGNLLSEHGHVTAMLDRETAHVGDPHEDLAWMRSRVLVDGVRTLLDAPVAGVRSFHRPTREC